jgi:hypothetical protein
MNSPAQRAACFDLQPFGLEKMYWIPAFAGMTEMAVRIVPLSFL